MSPPVCSRCSSAFRTSQPIFLPVDDRPLCAHCLQWTRHASKKLVERVCGVCARLMHVSPDSKVRHCSGSCRSTAFGLTEAQR